MPSFQVWCSQPTKAFQSDFIREYNSFLKSLEHLHACGSCRTEETSVFVTLYRIKSFH